MDLPPWFEKTTERKSTSKFSTGYSSTRKNIRNALRKMGADEWRVDDSSSDPTVVVRWIKGDEQYAVACDHYSTKKDNIRCIFHWIEETRKRADRPVQTGGDEFAAAKLMPPESEGGRPEPHEVLGVSPDSPEAVIKTAYQEKMKDAHPDQGGSSEEKELVQWAKEEML